MGGHCLRPDAPGHFLALRDEVGLIVAALAELVRTQQLNAPDARRNADTTGMPAVAIYMGVGCTCAKSQGAGECCCLSPSRAAVTLIFYHFASGVVEHVVGCFAAFRSFAFLL